MNSRAAAKRATLIAIALALQASTSSPLRAASIREPSTGVTLSAREDGSYSVTFESTGWVFEGKTEGPPSSINASNGRDGIGPYQELTLTFADGPYRSASIRTYEGRRAVLFEVRYHSSSSAAAGFPKLTRYPDLPYALSYCGKWAQIRFDLSGPDGPWLLFDRTGKTFVLSPASNFMVATLARTNGALESRLHPDLKDIPEDLPHRTLLVIEDGINRAFESWGRTLTDLGGKTRPANDADPSLASIGYWTDNGARYYYAYEPSLGYEGTLLAVRDEFRRRGLPLGYLQIDSWWYPKGESGSWNPLPTQWTQGIFKYEAHSDLFPRGLAAFQERLGIPLVTHARWIDPKSPYRKTYCVSNNVVVDRAYWDSVASYLKGAGVAVYEQDWLDQMATAAFNLTDQNAFMDNMAAAMAGQGLSLQYCMGTPRHLLQGSRYSNLTTARLSEDIFERARWDQFLYSSRLASALGIWPWTDVFESADGLLLSILSAGVVGVGTELGKIDAQALLGAARPDGILVKPDVPLSPTDDTILQDASHAAGPLVASTFTDHGNGVRTFYVFAAARAAETKAVVDPARLGLGKSFYVWDALLGSGHVAGAGDSLEIPLVDGRAYHVFAPIGLSGLAFLGDEEKLVPLGKKRIAALADDGILRVTVSFAEGEREIVLHGWAPARPILLGQRGSSLLVEYDEATGLFRLSVSPGPGNVARVRLRLAQVDADPDQGSRFEN